MYIICVISHLTLNYCTDYVIVPLLSQSQERDAERKRVTELNQELDTPGASITDIIDDGILLRLRSMRETYMDTSSPPSLSAMTEFFKTRRDGTTWIGPNHEDSVIKSSKHLNMRDDGSFLYLKKATGVFGNICEEYWPV